MFEQLFGHAAYLATQLLNARAACVAIYQAEAVGSTEAQEALQGHQAIVDVLDGILAQSLATVPATGGLLRQYSEDPPEGSARDLPELYEALDDEQQTAVTRLVWHHLINWKLALRLPDFEVLLTMENGEDFAAAVAAYGALLDFDCFMADRSVPQGEALLDDFVEMLMGAPSRRGPAAGGMVEAAPRDLLAEGAVAFERLLPVAQVGISLQQLNDSSDRAGFDAHVRHLVGEAVVSNHPDRFRLLWQSIMHKALVTPVADSPTYKAREVSQAQPTDQMIRRCVRVLAMVHELHKAGFQRLRIFPQASGSGAYWRCTILGSDLVQDDGFTPLDDIASVSSLPEQELVARYASASGADYFGWRDAQSADARQLASLFLERFPYIKHASHGRDWAYAGWLTDVLGRAESGRIEDLIVLDDYNHDEPKDLRDWRPPPPLRLT